MNVRIFITVLFLPWFVKAAAPEGFDCFALGYASSLSGDASMMETGCLGAFFEVRDRIYDVGDGATEIRGSFTSPIGFVTAAGKVGVSEKWGGRSHGLLRTDWLLGQATSLSLKWEHTSWSYISTSRNTIQLEMSTLLNWAPRSGLYASLGFANRWLRQRWNNPWWSPLHFDSSDQQLTFIAVIGVQMALWQKSYMTVDINNREPYGVYILDAAGIEAKLYAALTDQTFLIFSAGVRSSASWVGTMNYQESFASVGFEVR